MGLAKLHERIAGGIRDGCLLGDIIALECGIFNHNNSNYQELMALRKFDDDCKKDINFGCILEAIDAQPHFQKSHVWIKQSREILGDQYLCEEIRRGLARTQVLHRMAFNKAVKEKSSVAAANPFDLGFNAREKGLTISYYPFDPNARRQDYNEWIRGWFSGTKEISWNESNFLCDQCHAKLTFQTHKATNDHGGMVCLNGCVPDCQACGGSRACYWHEHYAKPENAERMRGSCLCWAHPKQCKCVTISTTSLKAEIEEPTPIIVSKWANDAGKLNF